MEVKKIDMDSFKNFKKKDMNSIMKLIKIDRVSFI